jgi:deoxyinosine 3'endonuclease (endonuclease V)
LEIVGSIKSKSGCIVFLNGAPITWITQKQECVASSTMEMEYIPAALAAREVYLQCLLNNVRFPQTSPTIIHGDNKGTICLVLNPEYD